MSRFDDELRRAAAPLANEPLPPDILDETLDDRPARPRWTLAVASAAGVAIVAVVVGLGLGELRLGPSPSDTPAPTIEASPMGAACEDVPSPSGGSGVVVVRFPCGVAGEQDLVSGVRSVADGLAPVERLEAGVRGLLDGPTELEASRGFAAVVPPGSSGLLADVELSDDGLATVGFTEDLLRINNLSTSAASGALLAALRETAFQFDEVTAILFTASGSCDAFFEFFQMACDHVARPVDGTLGDCAIIPPAELPSGAPITEPRPYPGQPIVSWGAGEDVVRLHAEAGALPSPDGAIRATVRGRNAWIAPSGDEPLPEPFEIGWSEDGCSYRMVVQLEGGLDAAIDYAGRIGPGVAEPSPLPGEPVTVSVEEEGIRLTVTLDRDRTTFGQRVVASTTVENVGPGTIFWGHSGTCPFPVHVEVSADDPEALPRGRTDWTGDEAILKNVTVDDRSFAADASFVLQPETWLEADGEMGCTADFVTSELREGESLTHVVAWDTHAHHGMPPAPGSYTVEAVFSFISRGASPSFGDEGELPTVSLILPLAVDGPPVALLSPGEAFDAVLADPRYGELLADAPRSRWMRSDLLFEDDRWVAALQLGTSGRDREPVEAIVATVDARTGEVLSVALEDR